MEYEHPAIAVTLACVDLIVIFWLWINEFDDGFDVKTKSGKVQ